VPRVPITPPEAPTRGNAFSRWLGRLALGLGGWTIEGELPRVPRCVIVVAPHTSNWDFVWGFATKLALGLRVDWIGKHTLFRGPFGPLLRWLGGIPVNRRAPGDIIDQAAEKMRQRERSFVAIAPEGTRRKVPRWKNGFHRIAMAAGVPIFPVALDYSSRAVRFFPFQQPTGDYDADLARLQALFHSGMAQRPENY
jgi:1-acyl-sn-glycerol-3-phosphate acyltransferase